MGGGGGHKRPRQRVGGGRSRGGTKRRTIKSDRTAVLAGSQQQRRWWREREQGDGAGGPQASGHGRSVWSGRPGVDGLGVSHASSGGPRRGECAVGGSRVKERTNRPGKQKPPAVFYAQADGRAGDAGWRCKGALGGPEGSSVGVRGGQRGGNVCRGDGAVYRRRCRRRLSRGRGCLGSCPGWRWLAGAPNRRGVDLQSQSIFCVARRWLPAASLRPPSSSRPPSPTAPPSQPPCPSHLPILCCPPTNGALLSSPAPIPVVHAGPAQLSRSASSLRLLPRKPLGRPDWPAFAG
jgi:hypothetical protein